MEGEGGGGSGAGSSGDGGDGGEQLLTVKHELRTGERPRPLPAGPAAEARLRARWGARAGQGGRGLGRLAKGGAWWAEASQGSREARGRGPKVCSPRAPSIGEWPGEMPSRPPSCTGDTSVTTLCQEGKMLLASV